MGASLSEAWSAVIGDRIAAWRLKNAAALQTVVSVEGAAEGYCREDKEDPAALLQFCGKCGSTTHFVLTANAVSRFGNSLMGVNMRLAEESDLAGIELRYPDGQAWSGEGAFNYVREARILGRSASSE